MDQPFTPRWCRPLEDVDACLTQMRRAPPLSYPHIASISAGITLTWQHEDEDANEDDENEDDANEDDENEDDANEDDANEDDANEDDANEDDENEDDENEDDANEDDENEDDENEDDENEGDANEDDANEDENSKSELDIAYIFDHVTFPDYVQTQMYERKSETSHCLFFKVYTHKAYVFRLYANGSVSFCSGAQTLVSILWEFEECILKQIRSTASASQVSLKTLQIHPESLELNMVTMHLDIGHYVHLLKLHDAVIANVQRQTNQLQRVIGMRYTSHKKETTSSINISFMKSSTRPTDTDFTKPMEPTESQALPFVTVFRSGACILRRARGSNAIQDAIRAYYWFAEFINEYIIDTTIFPRYVALDDDDQLAVRQRFVKRRRFELFPSVYYKTK